MMQQISLVIPTYNRFAFLLECVQHVLDDSRIGEICISDDCSSPACFAKVMKWAGKYYPKVSLYRSSINRDCYFNKHCGVELAEHDWVILFDDDNILPTSYLNTLFALPKWDENVVYCPEFAEPHFDYTAFSGQLVTRQNAAELMRRKHFSTTLNTANYFFHKNTWLGVWDGSVDPNTNDSLYQAYRLLDAGKKLYITPGLRYFHRVHDGSHFKINNRKPGTDAFRQALLNKLQNLK